MRSLVTGGAGFIGSHLVDELLELGHDVVVLDDLSTGRVENLKHCLSDPRVAFHHIDVRKDGEIKELFVGVDWVFHLAALADIVPSIEFPLGYLRAGVDATISVLEASRAAGVRRFMYAASSSCYGIPDVFPTPEDAIAKPQYPYALAKYLGEQSVMHWCQVYGLESVSLRLFNVYGPRARTSGTYGAVFGVFLAQKQAKEPFTVVGDGTQTRDFTYVTDVAKAFVVAAGSTLTGCIMNVGSSKPQSISYLVELLKGEVVYVPKRPGEPDCTFADVSRISSLLGWQTYVSFEDGVNRMLDRIDDWSSAPVWNPKSVDEATRGWFKYLGEQSG